MSWHIHDAEGKHVGDICTGVNNRYYVRTRPYGLKLYDVRSKHRTYKAALAAMAKEFAKGNVKRADILLEADYYDPIQVCELVRR